MAKQDSTILKELESLAAEQSHVFADEIKTPGWMIEWRAARGFNGDDWECYIPGPVKAAWPRLSQETRLTAFVMAAKIADEAALVLD